MTKGINRYDFEKMFGVQIEGISLDQMEELKREGLLEARAGQIYLSDKGHDLANYCMAKFLLD